VVPRTPNRGANLISGDREGRLGRRALLARSLAAAGAGLGPAFAAEGGAWPPEAPPIDVTTQGVVGDGRTDNSAALRRLCDRFRAAPGRSASLHFPPGAYVYADNRWARKLRRLRLTGSSAVLQCRNDASGWHADHWPLFLDTPFGVGGEHRPEDPMLVDFGQRILAAGRGSTEIRLLDAAGAPAHRPGDRVLVYGFDQQGGGFPPNARYFEFAVLASVDAAAGRLGLAAPLRHAYDAEGWPDTDLPFGPGHRIGAPRVASLERPSSPVLDELLCAGIEFRRDPSPLAAPGWELRARRIAVEGCAYDGSLAVNCCEAARLASCRLARLELDKLAGVVEVARCEVGDVTSAVGTDRVVLSGNRLSGTHYLAPRELVLEDNTFEAAGMIGPGLLEPYPLSNPTLALTLRRNRFRAVGEGPRAAAYAVRPAMGHAMRVAAVEAAPGGAVLVRPAEDDGGVPHAYRLMEGVSLAREGDGAAAEVRRIRHDGRGWVVEADWSRPPAPGDVWTYLSCQLVRDGGGNAVEGGRPLWDDPFWSLGGPASPAGEAARTMIVDGRDLALPYATCRVRARIDRFRLRVAERPAPGADPGPVLLRCHKGDFAGPLLFSAPLGAPGTWEGEPAAAANDRRGGGAFVGRLALAVVSPASEPVADPGAVPPFTLELALRPPAAAAAGRTL
jgi:hypothetical protein